MHAKFTRSSCVEPNLGWPSVKTDAREAWSRLSRLRKCWHM